ncbi:Fic family protein [Nonomuraea sp. NPDC059023]|uniref:Fic family protein n=1 Tax=unclassified Nonomuraea TaxID=2593643 RepID=UPI00369681B4
MLLGEAISKCEHVAGVPLQPAVAQRLNEVYLSKNAHATTQIEGNTLTEEEVLKRVRHELPLPPSQEYLGQEIDNVVAAYNEIVDDVLHSRPLTLTVDRVKQFNRLILQDLPAHHEVNPGEIRSKSVIVGSVYRGAPAEDCEHLLQRLCSWLEDLRATATGPSRKPVAILSAIVAHLYLAWIHPFWDGNGRTARLIEFQVLVRAGVPTLAAHVLADFYNRTRSEYYRVLAKTSREPHFPVEDFIKYALQGFVDELREQIGVIREQQLYVTWENFVHSLFRDRNSTACIRQRKLVLALPHGAFTPKSRLVELTPTLTRDYATKTKKTVTRDINALTEMGLITIGRTGVRPLVEQLHAFLPLRALPDEPEDA